MTMENDIYNGFVEALIFAETSCFLSSRFWDDDAQREIAEGRADGNIPNDAGAHWLDDESREKIMSLVRDFIGKARDEIVEIGSTHWAQIGRDLYFTRAGHGVGFWESEPYTINHADMLTEAAGRHEISVSAYRVAGGYTAIEVYC